MARQDEVRDCGFAIDTWGEDVIADEAMEYFLRPEDADLVGEFIAAGFMTDKGKITPKGWDRLTVDTEKFERSALAWLRKTFEDARDEGHDKHGALIGTVWWDPKNKKQRALIEQGSAEDGVIDANDRELSAAWKGCSDFSSVLGGQVTFFDTGLEAE
jgi:hypothetical protein